MTRSDLPTSLLIRGASVLLTGLPGSAMRHDVARLGGDLRVHGSRIAEIGRLQPAPGERVIDARGCVVQPGWVNTHHHLPLVPWLSAVPVRWRRHFDHEAVLRTAARVGLVELLLSGCTTVADHQYHYWPGMPFDASAAVFDEAARLGQRLVLCRGGQTRTRSIDVDPPPQTAPEPLEDFLRAVAHDTARFHDPAPDAMRRVACAPTTPTWSVAPEELVPIARAARALGIRLHSHLSESIDYVRFCREVHDCTPLAFVERHEWLGPDVWYAHMVHLSPAEVLRVAETGTGIAHCPQSNCRLGSGIAPIPALIAAAEIADVEAIHPGYGFLSENEHFAEVCQSCNIKFIGPMPDAIRAMGDQNTARATARNAGVPGTPGSDGLVETEQEALKVAKKIGYPVMIKAVAGGGGKGMRPAHNDVSLVQGFHGARMEAEKAFGNRGVYIEKLIENPHHIEFQIMADSHGDVVHIGERDCSMQRRNQKIIEETPSP